MTQKFGPKTHGCWAGLKHRLNKSDSNMGVSPRGILLHLTSFNWATSDELTGRCCIYQESSSTKWKCHELFKKYQSTDDQVFGHFISFSYHFLVYIYICIYIQYTDAYRISISSFLASPQWRRNLSSIQVMILMAVPPFSVHFLRASNRRNSHTSRHAKNAENIGT